MTMTTVKMLKKKNETQNKTHYLHRATQLTWIYTDLFLGFVFVINGNLQSKLYSGISGRITTYAISGAKWVSCWLQTVVYDGLKIALFYALA